MSSSQERDRDLLYKPRPTYHSEAGYMCYYVMECVVTVAKDGATAAFYGSNCLSTESGYAI